MKERVEQVFDPGYNIKRVIERARRKVRFSFFLVDFQFRYLFVNLSVIKLIICFRFTFTFSTVVRKKYK